VIANIWPPFTAFAVAWIVVRLIRRMAARLSLIDSPNARSSHRSPIPRGGGVGIVLGSLIGIAAAILTGAGVTGPVAVVLIATVAVAVVGLVDDVRGVSPRVRLAVHTTAAVIVVAYVGPLRTLPLPSPFAVTLSAGVAWVLSVIWICAVTNFFNFMDGIDGLAGGQAIASLSGVLLAAWSADASIVASCAAAATLGFLIQNWAPARVFMGDVGSGFLGFLLAALPLLSRVAPKGDAVLAVAVGMMLFLADPFETMVRRLVARESVAQAHRTHAYQQFVGVGESAGWVSAALVGVGFALSVLGAAAFRNPLLRWPALVVACCAYLVERGLSRRRDRRQRVVESVQAR
jgi:Fuc2NAc and GlcNAc transferase